MPSVWGWLNYISDLESMINDSMDAALYVYICIPVIVYTVILYIYIYIFIFTCSLQYMLYIFIYLHTFIFSQVMTPQQELVSKYKPGDADSSKRPGLCWSVDRVISEEQFNFFSLKKKHTTMEINGWI